MCDKIRHIIAYVLCYMVCLSSVYGHSDDGVKNADPVVTILFIVFGLGIGILIQQLLSKLGDPVPYTVVVFIAGLIFSSWNRDDAGMDVGRVPHSYLHDVLSIYLLLLLLLLLLCKHALYCRILLHSLFSSSYPSSLSLQVSWASLSPSGPTLTPICSYTCSSLLSSSGRP